MRRPHFAPLVPLAALTSLACGQSLLQQHGEVVLAAGELAPGIAGKTVLGTWSGITTPICDQNGTVLFQARLGPPGVDDRALYVGRSRDDLLLLAQSGTQAPGLPTGTQLRSSSTASGSALENDPAISAFGEITFFASGLNDPTNPSNTPATADTAFFWGTVGNLTAIAREGNQVPGLAPGVQFGNLTFSRQSHKIASNGVVCMPCELTGAVASTNDAAILTGTPGNLQLVAREGSSVNGTGLLWSTVFGNTMSNSFAINGNGEILLDSKFGGTANNGNDRGLVVWQPGSGATVLSREGMQVPGMASGVIATGGPGHGDNSWNDSGKTLFVWAVTDGGATITTANNTVVLYGGVGNLNKVLQEGDPTGLPAGETWGHVINESLSSNATNTLALISTLRDSNGNGLPSTNDSALFTAEQADWTTNNWTVVVREGEPIPAIPASPNGPWICGSVNGSVHLNALGQVFFVQDASDGMQSVDYLLLHDPVLGLQLVRDGQESYLTAVGTGQAYSGMTFAGSESGGGGSPMWLTNHGEFVFLESLNNGIEAAIVKGHSGSLIGTPSSIPATGGTHTLTIDCGAAHANHLYLVLGSLSGTSPGFPSPLGPITIPLNPDSWLNVALGYANTSIYSNTLGLLDGGGRPTNPVTFNLPPGVPGLAGLTLHHAVIAFDATFVTTFSTEPAPLLFR